jgi:type IV fimbrial biogenesis protein FimT
MQKKINIYVNKGVNLVELMISLSVLSILLALATPGMTQWIANVSIKNNIESINNGLNYARAESIKINQPIEFILGDNGSWSIVNTKNSEILRKRVNNLSNISTTVYPSGATTITYNGYGKKISNLDNSESISEIEIDSTLKSNTIYGAVINITSGGASKVCSKYVNSHNYCGD